MDIILVTYGGKEFTYEINLEDDERKILAHRFRTNRENWSATLDPAKTLGKQYMRREACLFCKKYRIFVQLICHV